MDRRRFLGTSTLAGAGLVAMQSGCATPPTSAPPTPPAAPATGNEPFELHEATVDSLQEGMRTGRLTARRITELYLARIEALNTRGPELGAIIETNPEALAIADALDAERHAGRVRGPLHGIPIALKDNLDTSDILMRGFGVTPDQVAAEALPFNDAARRLVAGTLDAAFVSAGYPSESVQIATRAGAHLVAVEGDAVTRLRTEYPFLCPTFVPGGTYPGHPASVSTVGADSLLLCRANLDEDLVYRLTAAFFEVLT